MINLLRGGFQSRKQSSVVSYPFQSRVAFIQGDSSSVIDVPVFIGTSLDIATVPITSQRVVVTPASALQGATAIRPRQQIDLTRRNSRPEKRDRPSYLRTMWIIICLVIICLALAGSLLPFHTDLQDGSAKVESSDQQLRSNVSQSMLQAIINHTISATNAQNHTL